MVLLEFVVVWRFVNVVIQGYRWHKNCCVYRKFYFDSNFSLSELTVVADFELDIVIKRLNKVYCAECYTCSRWQPFLNTLSLSCCLFYKAVQMNPNWYIAQKSGSSDLNRGVRKCRIEEQIMELKTV